ncbi:unnamed protein product [Bursaphelenchus xylophilus]|nr:unnamed protein product [Bursaphelenchus xylophilus]CAG9087761.1 unnamed protein product [Bursaphelenchus xylophilus]
MTGCPNFKQPVLGHFPASSKLGVANKKPSFGTLNILVKTPSRYDIWFSSYDKTSHFTVTQSKNSCEFRGQYYKFGDAFRPDVCSRCECSSLGIVCKRFVCPPNCRNPKYLPQVCCPFCDHRKDREEKLCYVQINGKINMYKESDEWNPEPCSICKCHNGEISCHIKTCPALQCQELTENPKDKCCPVCKIREDSVPIVRKPREPGCRLTKKGMMTSFDGEAFKLDSGSCEFVMTQRCALDGNASPFIITIKTSANGAPKKIGIELTVPNGFRLGKMYLLHGKELKYRNRRIKLPRESDRFNAFIDSNDDLNVKLHGTGVTLKWGPHSDIRIDADKSNAHILCGLCGNFNGHPSDDHWPQFGLGPAASTFEFIESWKTDSECGMEDLYGQSERDVLEMETEEDEELEDHCSKLISPSHRAERRKYSRNCKKIKKMSLLSSCRSTFPYSKFLKDCTVQVCKCEEKNRRRKRQNHRLQEPCYCRPIHNYVGECARRGLLTVGGADLMNLEGKVVLHPKCQDFKLGI